MQTINRQRINRPQLCADRIQQVCGQNCTTLSANNIQTDIVQSYIMYMTGILFGKKKKKKKRREKKMRKNNNNLLKTKHWKVLSNPFEVFIILSTVWIRTGFTMYITGQRGKRLPIYKQKECPYFCLRQPLEMTDGSDYCEEGVTSPGGVILGNCPQNSILDENQKAHWRAFWTVGKFLSNSVSQEC